MSLGYQISNPVGLNKKCQFLQTRLNAQLWTTFTANVLFHGLATRLVNEQGVKPQVYNGTKKDYVDVLHDDREYAVVFFDEVNTETVDSGRSVSEVDIIFAVNLKKLYPTLSHRAADEAIRDAFEVVNNSPFIIEDTIKGIEAYGNFYQSNDPRQNTQPYFLFKFVTNVSYRYDNNCN
jgi:hypothetical protein